MEYTFSENVRIGLNSIILVNSVDYNRLKLILNYVTFSFAIIFKEIRHKKFIETLSIFSRIKV